MLTATESAWMDMTDDNLDGMLLAAETAFTGGSTPDAALSVEMTPDGGTTVFVLDATFHAGLDGKAFKAYTDPAFAQVRFAWTVNGSPTTAVGNFWADA
jgi:hypothetical protein